MTQPSNLKVKRLVELDELPIENVGEAWTYAVQDNNDYKVSVAGIADFAAETAVEAAVEAVEEAANIIKDELSGGDGASLIGYGDTTVEAALDAIGDILDAEPEPPGSLTIVNDDDGNLWFRNGDNTVDRGLVYITGSGASQTMNVRVYDDSTGLYKTLSLSADGTITWDGYAVYHEGNIPPWDPGDPGDAVVADRLAIPRNINGTPFDGTTNITTANWGTARTLTIGSTGKTVNGSGNVTWTLSEIGAAPASHTHTIANITGLQSALDGKAASSHTHAIADIAGLANRGLEGISPVTDANDSRYTGGGGVMFSVFGPNIPNAPGNNYYHSISVSVNGTSYSQLALRHGNATTKPEAWIRHGNSTGDGAWARLWDSNNLTPAAIGAAEASHTHSASQITSGKFDTGRIPHITGDETVGWARLSSNGDNANLMGSLRILTGGASLRYYFEGSTVWQLNSNGSMVLHGSLSASSGNLTFGNAVDMPTNAKISWGGQGAIRANSSGVVVSAESGTVYLRPSGDGTSTNQTTINSSGHMSVSGNISSTGTISDADGPVRRAKHRVANGSGNLNAGLDLNGIIEKTNTSAVTYTIPSGLGSPGDIITIINSGSSGAITIARASGVSLYRNGTNANIVVQPGQMVSIVRTSANNRWQA